VTGAGDSQLFKLVELFETVGRWQPIGIAYPEQRARRFVKCDGATRIAAKATGGLVAPVEHTVNDLLAAIDVGNAWIAMPASDPLANAIDRLMQKRINLVIGMDAGGRVAGVIPRALRRY
jgi:hypothetical protein